MKIAMPCIIGMGFEDNAPEVEVAATESDTVLPRILRRTLTILAEQTANIHLHIVWSIDQLESAERGKEPPRWKEAIPRSR